MKTEISLETYNGHGFVSIWELDNKGVRFPKPLVSFGKKKFLAILKHTDDIKSLLKIESQGRAADSSTFVQAVTQDDIPF